MQKEARKPHSMVFPVPAVMVSCGTFPEKCNIITIAWTGTVCSDPPMCYISVRPERYSHRLIKENMDFVINYSTPELLDVTDWCGVKSGRDFNKFKETGLTPIASTIVKSPMIAESPISVECVVKSIQHLGVHDMFLAEIVSISIDPKLIDTKTNTLDLAAANPLAYAYGTYYMLGDAIGKYGYTAKK